MAELKLSVVWKIKEFAEQNARPKDATEECVFESDELIELGQQESLPGLQWQAALFTSSPPEDRNCEDGFAGFFLRARCVSPESDLKSIWAEYTATLLGAEGCGQVFMSNAAEYTLDDDFSGWGNVYSFEMEGLNKAVQKDGSLSFRIDLTILKIGEILKCRQLLRALLANKTTADFEVKVGDETFKLHKSVLAETSSYFSGMLQSGMEEATEGTLTLPDTTPAAFKAFSEAIYYDNWDFLSDVDLTQDVLHLAEKFNVANLKTYCDESLAKKVNESNALEILTYSAALCNAEETISACAEALSVKMEFKESQVWLDFKRRNRGVALEILDVVNDKLADRVKSLDDRVKHLERQNCELDAANADLKRKCEEETEKASSSKRRRK